MENRISYAELRQLLLRLDFQEIYAAREGFRVFSDTDGGTFGRKG